MDWSSQDPGWAETERDYVENRQDVRNNCPMTELLSDETEKGPPLQTHTLRKFEQHLNDLKKENFSLKLRIYFLEERIQQKYEESSEDVHRRNIELKVEVESLKQELQERQQLLDNALTTVNSLTSHNEELQRRFEERQQEIDHMQEILQTKIQLLQEEARLARSEVEKMTTLAESESQRCLALERKMKESPEDTQAPLQLDSSTEKDKLIENLTQALRSKEAVIKQLAEEKTSLLGCMGQLEDQVQDLSASLQQKEQEAEFFQDELGREKLRIQQQMQSLIEEQQSQLNQYECAAGQCVSELQKAQLQVQSLQARVCKSETENKKLQEKLSEMESELRALRQASQQRERTIQGLNNTLGTKDKEAQELYSVIEGQKDMLRRLREVAERHQLQHLQVSDREVAQLQQELVALQGTLFSTQLELQSSQRAEHRSQWRAEDMARNRDRLQADLEEALQHQGAAEQHNQELHSALQKTRLDLQAREGQLKELEGDKQAEVEAKDKIIRHLKVSLQNKEQLVQEYLGLLDQRDTSKTQNTLLHKLKERIKERDRALEVAIDDKFQSLEEKDAETRRLQLALREKERDMERLRYVLSKNEEAITTLEGVLRGRELELERTKDANKQLQRLKQEAEGRHSRSLQEQDGIISQLQSSLGSRAKEAQDLTAALLSKAAVDGQQAVGELQLRLELRERLFQEALSDRSRQAQEHQAQVQELLSIISSRDDYIKESIGRLSQVIAERTGELQELRRQLAALEQEVSQLSQQRAQQGSEPNHEIDRLQSRLRQKDSFIQVLMDGTSSGQDEPMVTSKPDKVAAGTRPEGGESDSGLQADVHAIKEELQLVLKKEKEAQLEICVLRSALAKNNNELMSQADELETVTRILGVKEELVKNLQRQLVDPSEMSMVERLTQELEEFQDKQRATASADHQVLEQLVSEYHKLSEAVKTEKQAYNSLIQAAACGNSSEKTWMLQRELDAVQALRGQLEGVLAKTRDNATMPAGAVKAQPDFGEVSTEEEEEDDGSSEYTDSIEEEENSKLTALTLAANQTSQVKVDLHKNMAVSPTQNAPVGGQGLLEVQQLVEQKKAVERELGELKTQLEKAGYSSLSQMRNALLTLRMENSELKSTLAQVGRRARDKVDACKLNREGRPVPNESAERGTARAVLAESQAELGPVQVKRSNYSSPLHEGQGKRRCTRPVSLDLGALLSHTFTQDKECSTDGNMGEMWQRVEVDLKERARQLRSDLEQSQQESQELQERLMVSEATVQAQAEQLKDYRELLTETSVQQDSKQVQVDLQDLGYETCGRSENEAEREDASSPEFDDLEMCTTLSRQECEEQWWPGDCGKSENVATLRQQVEELRSQLSCSRATIRSLQGRLRSLSSSSDYTSGLGRRPAAPWSFRTSPATSGLEEDDGWQSDGFGGPRWSRPSRELQELASRVSCLEDQLKTNRSEGKGTTEECKSTTWSGKFDMLIQTQARELSHLRQRVRVGRGVCRLLSQHLDDTTKAFEELLRANDIDYYMGQSFREQLAQSGALAERICASISGRDPAELLDDKMGHELLALRLSKELQQKDKIIECLRSKLKQQRPDTPSSSHALSETTNQSDRTSFFSDDPGSTHGDLELCSEVDAASEYAQEEHEGRLSPRQAVGDAQSHGSPPPQLSPVPSSTTASYRPQSPIGSPSRSCTLPCGQNADGLSQKGLFPGFMSSCLPSPQSHHCPDLLGQRANLLFEPCSPLGGPSNHGAGSFSLAEVNQELQNLQRQLKDRFAVPHVKPLSNFPLAAQPQGHPTSYYPLSHHVFHQSPLGSTRINTSLKTDTSIFDRSALWDTAHIGQPIRASAYGDVSSGSSGYQSGTSHTGAELMEEHLLEIRSLRQRLEDSIQMNDRLRKQLEERLASASRDGGAATNIYIQGLDSVTQLSKENQALKEENLGLQAQLKQASRDNGQEAEQLRQALLAAQARLKQVELEAERWQEEHRRLQDLSCQQAQDILQLRQDRQASQELTNRLKHDANLLQQQLSESRQLLRSLQCELQLYERIYGVAKSAPTDDQSLREASPLDLGKLLAELRSLRTQLEQKTQENGCLRAQLERQLGAVLTSSEPRPTSITFGSQQDSGCRRQLFHDPSPSPPVRDTGLLNSMSPYSMMSKSPEPEDPDTLSNAMLNSHSGLEGEAPDGSFANKNGRHTIGHVDDFNALQQQILEGKMLVHKMESMLQSSLSSSLLEVTSAKALDQSFVKSLLTNAKKLNQILEEATSLLRMFWRAALPSTENSIQQVRKEQSMKEEIHKLRERITEQEGLLQDTIQRLRSTNRTKESMEHFVMSQLSRTRDVLKKARTNLEKNEHKISSLSPSSSSSSPYPGEVRAGSWPRAPDWGVVKFSAQNTATGTAKRNDMPHQLQMVMF